jgi:hypothetical protein
MWKCSSCREEIDDEFDVCWQCGTDRSGQVDSEFERADAPPAIEAVIASTGKCAKCGYEGRPLLVRYRPPLWSIPLGFALALTGVGAIGLMIFFLVLRNRRDVRCPSCGSRDSLAPSSKPPSPQSEAVWQEAVRSDLLAAQSNNWILVSLCLVMLVYAAGSIWLMMANRQ